ncbi:maleylacetoacetate isomerase [Zooshikella harenae]|uniref:Maleylacetoacetate isomerase n=1 Tax=Zooshikella harenae TaxID=2827238 RepID=A0ABS5ZDI8_9GAMM|nr:maleylacetoacetate isomerase [Zooshikella harenae]MBU2711828.1 maleylacetoacetate isomerase [Zooshikella harenae]
MKLYSYWRSSTAYRLRIALNLKQVTYDIIPVHLVKDGGEQFSPWFTELNPQQRVPVLDTGENSLIQSMAILEWLEETHSEPPLLPSDPLARAQVRAMMQLIGCEIHPLNNIRVLQYLSTNLHIEEEAKRAWYQHWIVDGFTALEALLKQHGGQYCWQDQLTFADVTLIPQVYNAKRFQVDLKAFPSINKIYNHCIQLPAFKLASPESQPDAV